MIQEARTSLASAAREIQEAERWLSLSVACRRLGITRHTAYRWIEAGKIRRARRTLTGRWQVSAAAIEDAEARMRVNI